MTWLRENNTVIPVPIGQVWEQLGDLTAWPALLREFAAITPASGELRPGATGTFAISGLKAAAHLVAPGRFYVGEYFTKRSISITFQEPQATLRLTYTLSADGTRTRIKQSVQVEGILGRVMQPVAGRLHRGLWLLAARIISNAGATSASGVNVIIVDSGDLMGPRLAGELVRAGLRPTLLVERPRPHLPFDQEVWDAENLGAWVNRLRAAPERTVIINVAGPAAPLVLASRQCAAPLRAWLQVTALGESFEWGETGEPHVQRVQYLGTPLVIAPGTTLLDLVRAATAQGLPDVKAREFAPMDWVHIDDWLRLAQACLISDDVERGGLSAREVPCAAPQPISANELKQLMKGRFTPTLGEVTVPKIFTDVGYQFIHPQIGPAMRDLRG